MADSKKPQLPKPKPVTLPKSKAVKPESTKSWIADDFKDTVATVNGVDADDVELEGPPEPTKPRATSMKLSLVAPTILPDVWPAKNSGSSEMLRQAVESVVAGKPVSKEFLDELKRMLTAVEERAELVQVVLSHHQMTRLQKLHSTIEQVEAVMFNPKQIQVLEPDQQMRLLQTLYSEVATVTKFLTDKQNQYSATISDSIDPQVQAAQKEAQVKAGAVPAQLRRAIREMLASNLRTLTKAAS